MNRPGLFATGLAIKNFRGYGDFELTLPATPCVVLLSGPNGLGKTSLFEAIEWALTGGVKRLDGVSGGKADPRDLARRADGVDAVEVGLSFRDAAGGEERVRRTQLVPRTGTPPDAVGTKVGTVAELLRSDESRWNVSGKNLAEYLHLTHLHAQVAALRLVTFTAKERWVRVSPLAGADRFERVRTNLTNSKGALTKLKDRRAEVFQEALARRERWADLLRRLEQLQKLVAAMRDVLPPREAIRVVADLEQRLKISGGAPRTRGGDDVASASQAIAILRTSVERCRGEDEQRVDLLGRLRVLPRQMTDMTAQRSALLSRIEALEEQIVRFSGDLTTLGGVALGLKAALEELLAVRARAAERHERLTRAIRDRDDLVRLVEELSEADLGLKEAEARLEASGLELRRRRDELASHEALLAEQERAQKNLAGVDRAAAALAEVEALQRRIETEQVQRTALAQRARGIDAAATALALEMRGQDERVGVAEGILEERRKAAAALQQALLAIAEHTRDEDTSCPVCRTTFDPGMLRAIARSSVSALDPGLADAEHRLAALRAERKAGTERSGVLAQDRRSLDADLRALNDSLAQLQARVDTLAKVPLIDGLGIDDARKRIEQARAERQSEFQRIQREITKALPVDQLKAGVSAAGATADAAGRARSLAHERRLARQTRVEEVRARIAQLSAEYAELNAVGAALAAIGQGAALDASKAKDASDAAAAKHAEASAAEALARQTFAASNEELAKVRSQIDAVGASLRALTNQWLSASLTEPVSDGTIDAEIERLGQRRREFEAALADLEKVWAALGRWQQTTELQALEEEVRRQHGALDRGEFARELDAAVAKARGAAAAAQRARDAAEELSTTLGKVTADFGEQALKPFDELFRQYVRALVHDERFHSIMATYEPSARAAALRFRVDLGGSDTDAEYILSEGQLGEVSLAAMLAASTTFPWSRWRALLLDDPTQYNDLIHVTALFDVLRNLVRFARYQIIVSTHDNEQAGFLRRKLEGIGIPWVDCRYIAHAPEGIVADIRSSGWTDSGAVASAS